jgi:hypothetical protein
MTFTTSLTVTLIQQRSQTRVPNQSIYRSLLLLLLPPRGQYPRLSLLLFSCLERFLKNELRSRLFSRSLLSDLILSHIFQ